MGTLVETINHLSLKALMAHGQEVSRHLRLAVSYLQNIHNSMINCCPIHIEKTLPILTYIQFIKFSVCLSSLKKVGTAMLISRKNN